MKAEQIHTPSNLERLPVAPELVHIQLERLLSHPLFLNSKRFSSFLRFVVHHSLSKEHESLKERIIGIEVFGKAANFDTAQDSIVRVTATEVRRRLTLYYSETEHEKELRIELPTRSYVAEFSVPQQPQPPASHPRGPRRIDQRAVWGAVALLCLGLIGLGTYRFLSHATILDRFWEPLFNSQGAIPISVGTLTPENSGLPIPVSSKPALDQGLTISGYLPRQQVYSTRGDLNAAIATAAFLGKHQKIAMLQIAQDTTLEEMKRQPVFVLGSLNNEWAVRLGSKLRYHFQYGDNASIRWLEDAKNPASRAWLVDRSAPYDKDRKEYALITRALDQSTGRWWIGAAGLTGLGTSIAQQMITDPVSMEKLGKELPAGWDKKNLQIILEVDIVKESPGAQKVVATYSW